MEKTLRKLEKELRNIDNRQLIEFEENFVFKKCFTISEMVEDISSIFDLDFDTITSNGIDDFFETFECMFYDITKEKLSSVKENAYDLFIYCIKLYEHNRCIKSLEMIHSIRVLVNQLTKDEVFKLLSNDNIAEESGIFSNIVIKNFLKKYSQKYYDEFYKNQ